LQCSLKYAVGLVRTSNRSSMSVFKSFFGSQSSNFCSVHIQQAVRPGSWWVGQSSEESARVGSICMQHLHTTCKHMTIDFIGVTQFCYVTAVIPYSDSICTQFSACGVPYLCNICMGPIPRVSWDKTGSEVLLCRATSFY